MLLIKCHSEEAYPKKIVVRQILFILRNDLKENSPDN